MAPSPSEPGLCVNTDATLTPSLLIEEGEGAVSIPSPPERGLCVITDASLTPPLSLSEGEGAASIPSPPEGERVG